MTLAGGAININNYSECNNNSNINNYSDHNNSNINNYSDHNNNNIKNYSDYNNSNINFEINSIPQQHFPYIISP